MRTERQILTISASKTFATATEKIKINKVCDEACELLKRHGFTVMVEEDNLAPGDPENKR